MSQQSPDGPDGAHPVSLTPSLARGREIPVRTATRYHLGFLLHWPLPVSGELGLTGASTGVTSRPSGGRSDNFVVG